MMRRSRIRNGNIVLEITTQHACQDHAKKGTRDYRQKSNKRKNKRVRSMCLPTSFPMERNEEGMPAPHLLDEGAGGTELDRGMNKAMSTSPGPPASPLIQPALACGAFWTGQNG